MVLKTAQRVNTSAEIQPTTRVYDVVADSLVTSGVECIFGVMGEDTAPLVVAAAARGIAYHPARHENQAVAMADGYSRATGRVGIATVTGGPGFTNALTAINTVHRAQSRVAVLIGAGRPAEDDHTPDVVRQANGASWLKYFPQAAVLDLLGIAVVRPQTAGGPAAGDATRAMTLAREGPVVLVLGRSLLLTWLRRTRGRRRAMCHVRSRNRRRLRSATMKARLPTSPISCRKRGRSSGH